MKYICLIVLAPNFMTKICKKAAQHFHCTVSKVFDKVKSVALWSANIRKLALWSANIRKLAKYHKGYGSAANIRAHQTRRSGRLLRLSFNEVAQFLSKSEVLVALSVFSSPYFCLPIIILFLQYSHKRSSHVPEM
jgi:hypothetical protein